MLKVANKKLKKLGFKLIEENEYRSVWKRYDEKHHFTQTLEFSAKANGNHILFSTDDELRDAKNIGCTCVGLNYEELKACARKMKELVKKWEK